jgi:hypothetical protein
MKRKFQKIKRNKKIKNEIFSLIISLLVSQVNINPFMHHDISYTNYIYLSKSFLTPILIRIIRI